MMGYAGLSVSIAVTWIGSWTLASDMLHQLKEKLGPTTKKVQEFQVSLSGLVSWPLAFHRVRFVECGDWYSRWWVESREGLIGLKFADCERAIS
jgi:hypothetical protein